MGKLSINGAWCKGCSICAEFCPKNVLEIRNQKAVVVNQDACIYCKMCEHMCPEFAIFANKEDK